MMEGDCAADGAEGSVGFTDDEAWSDSQTEEYVLFSWWSVVMISSWSWLLIWFSLGDGPLWADLNEWF